MCCKNDFSVINSIYSGQQLFSYIMAYVIMLSTIMPYVIMLNVVAPIPWLFVRHDTEEKQLSHRPRSQGKSFSTTPIHIVVKKTVSV
jgi:hypothetical protein